MMIYIFKILKFLGVIQLDIPVDKTYLKNVMCKRISYDQNLTARLAASVCAGSFKSQVRTAI